jgi:hypothetical protein
MYILFYRRTPNPYFWSGAKSNGVSLLGMDEPVTGLSDEQVGVGPGSYPIQNRWAESQWVEVKRQMEKEIFTPFVEI